MENLTIEGSETNKSTEEKYNMRMKDLPVPQFQKPLNRRVYSFFWLPCGICWDLVAGLLARFLRSSCVGFGLAAFGWMLIMGFMYFMGALTSSVALGTAVIAVLTGAGITALLAIFS